MIPVAGSAVSVFLVEFVCLRAMVASMFKGCKGYTSGRRWWGVTRDR